jgi:hypothetical protein
MYGSSPYQQQQPAPPPGGPAWPSQPQQRAHPSPLDTFSSTLMSALPPSQAAYSTHLQATSAAYPTPSLTSAPPLMTFPSHSSNSFYPAASPSPSLPSTSSAYPGEVLFTPSQFVRVPSYSAYTSSVLTGYPSPAAPLYGQTIFPPPPSVSHRQSSEARRGGRGRYDDWSQHGHSVHAQRLEGAGGTSSTGVIGSRPAPTPSATTAGFTHPHHTHAGQVEGAMSGAREEGQPQREGEGAVEGAGQPHPSLGRLSAAQVMEAGEPSSLHQRGYPRPPQIETDTYDRRERKVGSIIDTTYKPSRSSAHLTSLLSLCVCVSASSCGDVYATHRLRPASGVEEGRASVSTRRVPVLLTVSAGQSALYTTPTPTPRFSSLSSHLLSDVVFCCTTAFRRLPYLTSRQCTEYITSEPGQHA